MSYLIFKRYEPERIPTVATLLLGVPAVLTTLIRDQFTSLLVAGLTTCTAYWSLILSFTVAYRLSPLHPLAKYPGPLLCKISKGWLAYVVAKGGKAHVYVHQLHKQYNLDVVRIGMPTYSFHYLVI